MKQEINCVDDARRERLMANGKREYWISTGKLDNLIENICATVTEQNTTRVEMCRTLPVPHWELKHQDKTYCLMTLCPSKETAITVARATFQQKMQFYTEQNVLGMLPFFQERLDLLSNEI